MSGLFIEKRPDDIIIMSVDDVSRQTIHDWAEQIQALYHAYHMDARHLRLLYNFNPDIMPTPYLIKRAIGVLNTRHPDLVMSAAMMVTNQNIAMSIIHIMKRIRYAKHVCLVKSEEEGIVWLNERHSQYQQGIVLET